MKKIISFALLFVFIINMTGCATILKEKKTKVTIDSEPQGATIYHKPRWRQPVEIGKTPLTLPLDNKHDYHIIFKKNGYEDKKFVLRAGVAVGWQFASLCCAILPGIVDFFSKNARNLKQTEVKVQLQPGLSTLNGVTNSNTTINSNADELLKYKKLLDSGAITKDEYEQKKKQLLGQ